MFNMPDQRLHVEKNHSASMVLKQQQSLLWFLFFLICLGLGHAPLNRYDPGKLTGTTDVADYEDIVVGRRGQPAPGSIGLYARINEAQNLNRVLVPYVAKPFYWLGRGHIGTWDPALFGLLVANAIFTATTGCLLVAIGYRLTLSFLTALLGATLFLLNFCVTNYSLAGMVDSAEGCFLLAIVWSLLTGRWFLLPLWGVFGALAKETFAPISAMFVFGWWVSEVRRDRLQLPHLAWMSALGVVSMATVTLVMSTVAGGLVWPWQYAAFVHDPTSFLTGLRECIFNHGFWYIFIWLLPVGLVRVRRLPRPWVLATVVAFCGVLAMGAYNNAGGSTSRALFSVAGPLLSLSTAVFLAGPQAAKEERNGPTGL
jgi:hypothetical protein